MKTVIDKFSSVLSETTDKKEVTPIPKSLYSARQAGIPEDSISKAAADSLGIKHKDSLADAIISDDFLERVPIAFARRHAILGLSSSNGTVPVAISSVQHLGLLENVSKFLGKHVSPVIVPRNEILRTINLAYQQQNGMAQKVIEDFNESEVLDELKRISKGEDLLDVSSRAPVIKLVNLIFFEAVKRRASDVHVQPYEDKLIVRFRIDGVLHDAFHPPVAIQSEIISRIKIMGGMNIAERRLAQDGRATVQVGDRIIDLRIATLPTNFGERAVIRLLDKSVRLYKLPDLGMPEHAFNEFERLIRSDHGIVLVTGPTGSGKSTTLYAALQEINSKEFNILTLEDPIEYQLEGTSQTQVNNKKGMTFASGLRHVLRQDPDIIMVGEIRDRETAQMAIQSALTGHLVFSTLHTNDAASAVARMLDLGVEPYLLASSLLGVLAQRLVRRICPDCKSEYIPSENDLRIWNLKEDTLSTQTLYKGNGCQKCLDTGYIERVGIFELLNVNEPMREQILQNAKASSIKGLAVKESGMVTLRSNGIQKAFEGITTMDEVARVTGRDDF